VKYNIDICMLNSKDICSFMYEGSGSVIIGVFILFSLARALVTSFD